MGGSCSCRFSSYTPRHSRAFDHSSITCEEPGRLVASESLAGLLGSASSSWLRSRRSFRGKGGAAMGLGHRSLGVPPQEPLRGSYIGGMVQLSRMALRSGAVLAGLDCMKQAAMRLQQAILGSP